MAEMEEKPINDLVEELKERAKELNCLYEVQEALGEQDIETEKALKRIIEVIPPGWQYPDCCQSEITLGKKTYRSSDFSRTPWVQHADIQVRDQVVGKISVYYTEEKPQMDEGPFLLEERRLINTIADQVGNFLLHQKLQDVFEKRQMDVTDTRSGWRVILDLLQKTDSNLLITIARKTVHLLYGSGVKEAEGLLELFSSAYREERDLLEANAPYQFNSNENATDAIDQVFNLAEANLDDEVILTHIQEWIREDQSGFLINAIVQPGRSVSEILAALDRFSQLSTQGLKLSDAREQCLRISLIRKLLSEQPQYIDTARKHIQLEDYQDLAAKIIYHSKSFGKLGGKGAGLFLAMQIIKKTSKNQEYLQQIKTPKTWYILSDVIFSYIEQNNLEEIVEHKYLNLEEIRQEYPYIIQVFNNSILPPEIIKGLYVALDDFGDVPLIVRSSSLLEDQFGVSFAGKYKSLFLSNTGSKEERLKDLSDAITEVYASLYGPDPIEYRSDHRLIDHHEEMGIMIQEVVGRRIGPYYFPAYAGVGFSQNEFRWSSRIKKQDGLARMVPGLGTRAVDRLSNDYPILAAPGKPGLRVNTSLDEIIRYSPKMMDVINLETGSFETVDVQHVLKEWGHDIPNIKQLISVITADHAIIPSGIGPDYENDHLIFTFDGLFTNTPFLARLRALLAVLEEELQHPVDIEFACDGDNFYLLQCRSQSYGDEYIPAEIPHNIPEDRVLFTADRYISNGLISDLSHIVYVDPLEYSTLPSKEAMLDIGRIVSKLNKTLPRRRFILIGPGRWGSRGDIKLGVSVTYSDINNTAALIEVAQQRGDYTPDPSFGTHFFQDLVESKIRYIPLYPDDPGIVYNLHFLQNAKNILGEILPDYAHYGHVLRVIDLKASFEGNLLSILMNAEKNKAIAMLTDPHQPPDNGSERNTQYIIKTEEDYWQWRLKIAEEIAQNLDMKRFGVKGIYLIGSTKNATAGPQSDIDILIHFAGSENQRGELKLWLEGWSLSLSEINQERTGYQTKGLLDVAFVTDEDIQNRTSYAVKIGAISDPALPLRVE